MIQVKNISTVFNKNIIHDNISFDINDKEIFGILGGSGSGKSTLLRQMILLEPIQGGHINIFEKDIKKLIVIEKMFVLVFNFILFSELSFLGWVKCFEFCLEMACWRGGVLSQPVARTSYTHTHHS